MNQQRKSRPIITACTILLIAALLIVGLFVCVILRACSEIGTPDPSPLITPSATVSGEGTLIFQSKRDGNSEIYRVQADGTGLTNLTNDPGSDKRAAWSPDGKQIAFNSDRGGLWGLYVMNADGSNPRRLYWLEELVWPEWSSDGKWIALSGVSVNRIVNADGSGERPVTADERELCSTGRVWSPDGTQFACETGYSSGTAIAVRHVDLERTTYLTVRRFNEAPAWSPDGTRIAFRSWNTGMADHEDFYAANPDGSGLTKLTDYTRTSGASVWSPDGTKVANVALKCESFLECGSLEIWVANANGTGNIQLTYNDLVEGGLHWSPDGTRISFAARSNQAATAEPYEFASSSALYIINADGSAQVQLVAPDDYGGGHSWQPIAP